MADADKVEVGTAYVAIIPSAKGFAKNLQKEIAKEFAGSNLDKLIADALAGNPVSLPVKPTVDPGDVPDEVPVRRGKEPKLPVKLDPLTRQLQADIRRELAGITQQALTLDVDADTADLRAEISDAIAGVEATLSADVPTEPAGRAEYARLLREQVDAVAEKVRARIEADVDVDVDTDKTRLAGERIGDKVADAALPALGDTMNQGLGAALGSLGNNQVISTVGTALALGLGAVAAPLLAASLSGAVLAGVGGGVIGLGILGVMDDPRFKSAASRLGDTIKSTLITAAAPLLGTEEAQGPLLQAMQTLENLVIEIGPSLEQMFTAIGPYIPVLAEGFADFVREAMPGLLKAVEASGPILEVIAQNLGPLGEDVGGFLTTMAELGPAAADALNVIFFIVGLLIDQAAVLLYALGSAFGGLFNLAQEAKDRVQIMWDFISNLFTTVGASVKEKAEALVGAILRKFRELVDGSKRAIDSAVGFFADLPGRISKAVGNLGGLLLDAGKNVVQGLIDGIKSMFGALERTSSSMAGTIRKYLPFSPAKEGPLSGRGSPELSGRTIVDMLAAGITGNLGTARQAADRLAGTFALGASPLTTAPAGGYALAAATQAPAGLTVEWVGGDGDPIIRAIREHTRIYYGGSVQAAIGS